MTHYPNSAAIIFFLSAREAIEVHRGQHRLINSYVNAGDTNLSPAYATEKNPVEKVRQQLN
jgi:hypothetical protein